MMWYWCPVSLCEQGQFTKNINLTNSHRQILKRRFKNNKMILHLQAQMFQANTSVALFLSVNFCVCGFRGGGGGCFDIFSIICKSFIWMFRAAMTEVSSILQCSGGSIVCEMYSHQFGTKGSGWIDPPWQTMEGWSLILQIFSSVGYYSTSGDPVWALIVEAYIYELVSDCQSTHLPSSPQFPFPVSTRQQMSHAWTKTYMNFKQAWMNK